VIEDFSYTDFYTLFAKMMIMVEAYKAKFIDDLLSSDVLQIGGPFQLKSGRKSPSFAKLDSVNSGKGLIELGSAYAATILDHFKPEDFDGVVGIPKKAHVFGPAIVTELARQGADKKYSSWRDAPKTYGDATASVTTGEKEQRQKEYVLGSRIPDGSRQILVDDVMTAGDAKNQAVEMINYLASGVDIRGLVIAVNRQEVDEWGENAIDAFTRSHGIPIHFVVTMSDIFDHLKSTGKLSPADETKFLSYFRAWGVKDVRDKYDLVSKPLIEGRTVIPACDIYDLDRFEQIVRETADMDKVGGYKVGFQLGLLHSLPRVVEIVKKLAPAKKVIYDHQKAGTDIPDTGFNYAEVMKQSGVDAAILFPESGPVTQVRWMGELLQAGIEVFVGGEMTHKGYKVSDGGYISDEALETMYRKGAERGVIHYIVPGNKIDRIGVYKALIESYGIPPVFASPGLITQGGVISDAARVAGENWHAIVGRDIMNAKDIRSKVNELTSQL
jgi:orotidine-5'-phosphate decarboxylase